MREFFIDIETFSPVNLAKTGVYPYADHDDFELLLFGYSIDGGPVEIVDLANGQQLPSEVLAALVDPEVTKWAFNAAFERVCLSSWLARHHPHLMVSKRFLDPAQWRCTMVWSAYLGLPMSLDQVATVLDLPVRKDSGGKKLIPRFAPRPNPASSTRVGCVIRLHATQTGGNSSSPTIVAMSRWSWRSMTGWPTSRSQMPNGTPTPWTSASTIPASGSTESSWITQSSATGSIAQPPWLVFKNSRG